MGIFTLFVLFNYIPFTAVNLSAASNRNFILKFSNMRNHHFQSLSKSYYTIWNNDDCPKKRMLIRYK
jgi:hypothetical protein